jgi:uncharacterized membrane protein YgcG
MFLWILIVASASTSFYFIDMGSDEYTFSQICPIIFAVSVIVAFMNISNLKGGSSSSGGYDSSSGGWSGGGDCGGGDGGC